MSDLDDDVEDTRRHHRAAFRNARELERERRSILAAAAGDPVAVAENMRIVARLHRDEQDA